MRKEIIFLLALFSASSALATEDTTKWAELGNLEQSQIILAASNCRLSAYGFVSTGTTVSQDGSVGFQGVYNYFYTTTLVPLDQSGKPVENTSIKVISEHVADIDTDPVSFQFVINSVNSDGRSCLR